MTDPVARRIQIYGRVQGVFFRQWAVHKAREMAVTGWVRNLPSGSVEAYVAGEEQSVSAMVECLRQGPDGARVEACTVEEALHEENDGFSVRI